MLDVPVGLQPAPVRGAAGLFAANVDGATAFARWLEPRKALLASVAVRGTYLDEEDVGRLLKLSLPGIDEVIGLLEIVRMAREATEPFDHVIVDTAPTGHTLRLLAAPALLGKVAVLLDRLQSHHRAVVSALRGSYRADEADAMIVEMDQDGDALAAMLRDRAGTAITWVTLPEPMALEETSDAIAALESSGIRVQRLIVNRLTAPPPQPCDWCDARRRFESRAVAPIARRFAGREILAVPELVAEPRGIPALRRAATSMGPWVPPAAQKAAAATIRAAVARPGTAGSSLTSSFEPVASALKGKILFFGGKGGVGKSTCAAAAALQLADDRRVLLLSTDPAHSLGDVFGIKLDNLPRPVPGAPADLHVREIDAQAEMDRFRRTYLAAVDDAFARIARAGESDQTTFRELIDLAPPGIDEVIAIADVADAISGGKDDYDVVVVDTAPTGHALRLLQTPAVLRDWALALMAILLKYREVVGAGSLASLLVRLSRQLRGLQDILADPSRSRFVIVTRGARVPIDETLALIGALRPIGLAVDTVIVNAAGAGACTRCEAMRGAQRAATVRLRRCGAASTRYAIIEAPAEIPPPHGAARLRSWGLAWRLT